jgi:uncharacterized membrane protein YozB (DUF420 family)
MTDQPLPGIEGFIPGSRGSIMLDVVFVAMFAILPVLALSIYLVRYRQQYALHKKIQLVLGLVLLLAVVAFEFDMQFITRWELRAEPSPLFDIERKWTCPVGISLLVHLFFAIPTAVLWVLVITEALRKFPNPPHPSPYSPRHLFWARLAAFEMVMTAITGWVFYWLAFVVT